MREDHYGLNAWARELVLATQVVSEIGVRKYADDTIEPFIRSEVVVPIAGTSKIGEIEGAFAPVVAELNRYELPDGRIFDEYVHAAPWHSGPCYYIALKDSAGSVPCVSLSGLENKWPSDSFAGPKPINNQSTNLKTQGKYQMKKFALAALLGGALALAGCATAPSVSVHQLQPGQPYWMTTDASARGITLLPRPDGKGMFECSEPSPDAMLQTVAQLTAQVQLQNPQVDAQTQVQFSTAVIELTQRTQDDCVLTRSLFRTCEQAANQNLNSDQIMQLYTMAMQTALKMARIRPCQDPGCYRSGVERSKVQRMFDQLVNGIPATSSGSAGGIATGVPTAGPVPKLAPIKH